MLGVRASVRLCPLLPLLVHSPSATRSFSSFCSIKLPVSLFSFFRWDVLGTRARFLGEVFGTIEGFAEEETRHVLGPQLRLRPDIVLSDCFAFGETVDDGRVRGDELVEIDEGLEICAVVASEQIHGGGRCLRLVLCRLRCVVCGSSEQ